MIVYVRLGVLVRWVLGAVVTTVIAVGLILPGEPEQTSPTGPPSPPTSTTAVEGSMP